nr:unnamed protein product [Haemonchus contortus]
MKLIRARSNRGSRIGHVVCHATLRQSPKSQVKCYPMNGNGRGSFSGITCDAPVMSFETGNGRLFNGGEFQLVEEEGLKER